MPELRVKSRGVINFRLVRGRWTYLECNESMFSLEILTLSPYMTTLFIFYKNIIFWSKPSKEIEIATDKITTIFLILERFQALMF